MFVLIINILWRGNLCEREGWQEIIRETDRDYQIVSRLIIRCVEMTLCCHWSEWGNRIPLVSHHGDKSKESHTLLSCLCNSRSRTEVYQHYHCNNNYRHRNFTQSLLQLVTSSWVPIKYAIETREQHPLVGVQNENRLLAFAFSITWLGFLISNE